ncbi:unnamed protein product [Clavelina lepadiformis]|uniref:FAS1 domain-containing protein n=1 Tax=Clavelina lepadiformis TaxID=159417 RepID=A0ABP0FAQ0_CLALP
MNMSLSKPHCLSWRYARTSVLWCLVLLVAQLQAKQADSSQHFNYKSSKRRYSRPTYVEPSARTRKTYFPRDDASVPMVDRYPDTYRIVPFGGRAITKVTKYISKPTRIHKILTEQNGKLANKVMPDRRTISPTKHVPRTTKTSIVDNSIRYNPLGPKSTSSVTRNLHVSDRFTPTYNYNTRLPARNIIPFDSPTNSVISARYSDRPTIVQIASSEDSVIDSEAGQRPGKSRSSNFKLFRPPPDRTTIDSEKYLSDLIPPPGTRIVLASENDAKPKGSSRLSGLNLKRPRHLDHALISHRYPPTNPSSPEVLRIRTTSVSEAQALISELGGGFKISIFNASSEPDIVEDKLQEEARSVPVKTTTLLPVIADFADRTSSPRRDATAHVTQWWKGEHVCVKVSPGLFGLTEAVLKRVKTKESCREKRNRYVCTEKYGFGKHSPKKTTIYKCCPQYKINKERNSCVTRSSIGHGIVSHSENSNWLSQMSHADSIGARAAADDEILTIFMPSDDVVLAAFMIQNETSSLEETLQVQSFLENHVIPGRKLLVSQMHDNEIFSAVSGNPIRVNVYPGDLLDTITVNCRRVTVTDIINDNSVVHFIDNIIDEITGSIADYITERFDEFSTLLTVLSNSGLLEKLHSSNGSYTLFAPTNEAFRDIPVNTEPGKCLDAFARNHISERVLCTAGVERGQNLRTLFGDNITVIERNGKQFIGDSEIKVHDIMRTNGVIHVINRVLKPTSVSSVLDVLSSEKSFSSTLEMFQAAGIQDALATGGNFTLIVPTNRAFKELSKSELMNLLLDAEGLRSLLKFHVIPQQISIRDLKTRDKLETLSPPMDIHVSNYMKRVRSRRRRYLRKPVSALQCAMVVGQPEVVPCNGAILIVDKVLQPASGTILSALMYSKKSNFSTLLAAIRRTGIEQILDRDDDLTFFAPSEAAFSRFPVPVTQLLLSNKKLLRRVLRFHLISGYHCGHALLQRSYRHTTLLGSQMTSCPKRKTIFLGRKRKKLRAKVVESDILASNGIVHAIDNLLLPRNFNLRSHLQLYYRRHQQNHQQLQF